MIMIGFFQRCVVRVLTMRSAFQWSARKGRVHGIKSANSTFSLTGFVDAIPNNVVQFPHAIDKGNEDTDPSVSGRLYWVRKDHVDVRV